jgi:molybdate transport system substrate-binding protein
MKLFLRVLGLMVFIGASASAQTAQPAQPVDPHQALPAQAVEANPTPAPTPPGSPTATDTTNGPGLATASVALNVIADGSLRQVLQELAQSWADSQESSTQVPVTLTNAGTLRAKVQAGSTWDVVISADVDDMKAMSDKGLLLPDGQRTLARNTLVIYGRNPLIKDDELEWFDLIGHEWKKVAMGNPDLVVSGRVALRALQKHGLADEDHKNIFSRQATETQVLGEAQREVADAVFVYKTDLVGIDLHGFQLFPLNTEDAPPIFYTAAICRQAKNPALARSFLDYCSGDAANEIWKKYGFETN